MTTLAFLAAGFCALATLVHLLTTLLAVWRCRVPRRPLPAPADAPPISLVRPVCGIETFSEATLRSSFRLDYPRYELIFCVARGSDPVIPLVRRLIAEHPGVPAKLLIGDDRISANPKLNNMVKGWHGAAHDHIVFADSNVLMPVDYLQRMLRAWTHRAGMVCAPPAGTHPDGFWAQVECAFLNTYQARFQYAADSLGIGFAQGKNLLYRRDILERGGGIAALATELAEDAASTKVVRAQGLTVRLAGPPFPQPLGWRPAGEVWNRQVRWARLRRATFAPLFAGEVLSGSLPPLLAGLFAISVLGLDRLGLPDLGILEPLLFAFAFLALWFGAEAWLARAAGWPFGWLSPVAWMLRDAMLPLIWLEGWRAADFTWRGNVMTPATTGAAK